RDAEGEPDHRERDEGQELSRVRLPARVKSEHEARGEIEKRGQREHQGQREELREDGDRDRRRAEAGGAEDRVPDEEDERRDDERLERDRPLPSAGFPPLRPHGELRYSDPDDLTRHGESATVQNGAPRVPALILGGRWVFTLSIMRSLGRRRIPLFATG